MIFLCPTFTLYSGFVLEAGACSVKLIQGLYRKSKDKFINNIRMSENMSGLGNISKQKMSPVLALCWKELTIALEDEDGNRAKGAWSLLRMFNGYSTQPLLTVLMSKGWKIKEALMFGSPEGPRLIFFREMSAWLLNDWSSFAKQLPASKDVPTNDNISLKLKIMIGMT